MILLYPNANRNATDFAFNFEISSRHIPLDFIVFHSRICYGKQIMKKKRRIIKEGSGERFRLQRVLEILLEADIKVFQKLLEERKTNK